MRNNRLHVAVIMDGNGRWATSRGLPRLAGHRRGADAVRKLVEGASAAGIGCLSLYAFSSDNWRRPFAEVDGIFSLIRIFLRREVEILAQAGVRLEVIGRRDRLPQALRCTIEDAESVTARGGNLLLRLAIDYSSRDAIAQALGGVLNGGMERDSVRSAVTQALEGNCGDVDLMIRTGGEKRLSDFLLWESAYAEFAFTERMWPDFGEKDFTSLLAEFHKRERRFGMVATTPAHAAPIHNELLL